ncbi:MAG: DUF2325 domain-containing protein [Labilithrix sp.]|nr:DUF2325 domain-containing protein [Labilithrix sp.]MCW5812657.1 DUF2325 domain-containing protein [Labilithrix sp.]
MTALVATSLVDRRRIWQIDAGMHCSVLGTCLTLNDLHAIARRARYKIDPETVPYKLHSWFVDMMLYPNEVSKLVDKELEKRHQVPARILRRARTEEELEARWKEVCARGQIAGAYWGAMSHPLCSKELQWRLFGEIHMLSHLVGASRSSDVARVHDLEVTSATLDGKLAQLKHDHRSLLKDRRRLEEEMAAQRSERDEMERRLRLAHDRIAALESTSLVSDLAGRVEAIERDLAAALARATAAESALAEARTTAEQASEHVSELVAETEALEHELELATRPLCPLVDGRAELTAGLDGKRILCVGGRTNLVQHYRALVERRGGELIHHDGGIEESLDAVTRALATVDAVVCPLDCVSHAAYLKVKRACKHMSKRFLPLRTSGLSSFARGVQSIAGAS